MCNAFDVCVHVNDAEVGVLFVWVTPGLVQTEIIFPETDWN